MNGETARDYLLEVEEAGLSLLEGKVNRMSRIKLSIHVISLI